MTARTRWSAGLIAAVSLVALTGCQQPTPLVSLVSGGRTVHSEASVYCFAGQSAEKQNCRTPQTRPTVLRVKANAPVNIDVSKPLAKAGWVVILPGEDADPKNDRTSGKLTSHYFSLGSPQLSGPLRVEVRMLNHGRTDVATVGNWEFVLVPA